MIVRPPPSVRRAGPLKKWIKALPDRADEVDLCGVMATDKTIEALLEWPGLKTIAHLDVSRNRISDEGFRKLADTVGEQLVSLNIAHNGLRAASVETFSRAWPNLETLNISSTKMAGGLAKIEIRAPKLRKLTARWARVGAAGAKALAKSQLMNHVEWLDFQGNALGKSGVKALLNALHDSAVTHLHLGDNGVPRAEQMRDFTSSPARQHLRSLGIALPDSYAPDDVRAAFAGLDLTCLTAIVDSVQLAAWPGLEALRALRLTSRSDDDRPFAGDFARLESFKVAGYKRRAKGITRAAVARPLRVFDDTELYGPGDTVWPEQPAQLHALATQVAGDPKDLIELVSQMSALRVLKLRQLVKPVEKLESLFGALQNAQLETFALDIDPVGPELDALLEAPVLAEIDRLVVHPHITPGTLVALAERFGPRLIRDRHAFLDELTDVDYTS